jgi:hypothetical protein
MKTKLTILLGIVAFAFVGSGCRVRYPEIHPLNMRVYDSGFVNEKSSRHKTVRIPKEMVLINELPGSQGGYKNRLFVASPLRLDQSVAGRVKTTSENPIENNKFVIELRNSDSVPGLPATLQPDTVATLRYVGNATPYASWETDAVDTKVNTLRLVVRPSGCRNGSMIYNHDWICSDVRSRGIFEIQEGQRIKKRP